MPRIAKTTKKFIRKRKHKKVMRKKRGSHVVTFPNKTTRFVFQPRIINEWFPGQFVTTMRNKYRFTINSGLTPNLSSGTQSFNIQLAQLYRPTTTNAQAGFVVMAAMSPACTFLGDYAGTASSIGYQGLMAAIYDEYIPLRSTIKLTLDNYINSSDQVLCWICPIAQSLVFQTGSQANYVSEEKINTNKYTKKKAWPLYTAEGSTVTHSIKHSDFYGYRSDAEYIGDPDNNAFNVGNTNKRPGNDGFWQLGFTSATSVNTAGACQFTVEVITRVLWKTIATPLSS